MSKKKSEWRKKKRHDNRGTYRAIYVSLWDDPEFLKLSPNAKLVFLNLRTGPLTNLACIYRFYKEALHEQTGLPNTVLDTVLDTLCDTGWIQIEENILWVKNAVRYDPNLFFNNPLHIQAIKNILLGLPKLKIVIDFCTYYEIEKPYEIPSRNGITNGIVYPEKEKEEEKEKEKDMCEKENTTQEIVNLFNSTTQYLPKVTELGRSRKDKIKTRIKEGKDLEWWKVVFEKADMILIPGKDGKKDWFPNFDWLIDNDKNAVKVFEGNYDDAKRPKKEVKYESPFGIYEDGKKVL
jgi:hypothetical protein